jgi:hypothetical protein
MTLRQQLKRLAEGLRGTLESFLLEDGSRHYYDPTSGERFLHSMDCLRAQGTHEPYPEAPETVKAITRARDRRAAFEQVYGDGDFATCPYDKEALVERGELVPRSMVAGREMGEPVEDLSE